MSSLKEFSDANFEQDVLKAEGTVLVDFSATWCGPCKAMAPVVDDLAQEYAGKVTVGKLDVDQSPKAAMQYDVRGVPTLGVFRKGELVDRLVGFPGPRGVRTFVEKQAAVEA
ncbi:MAG: thioredoxin [Candidatus Dormibacteraceae bacterium]